MDEAESFITRLVQGGAGGPAGLLWVRRGITGIEARSRSDEESDHQVRATLLESVQGEVEAVTGGRRMAAVIAAAAEATGALLTPSGRPKAGGRYATAIALRDQLAQEAQRLKNEVTALRDELDQRGGRAEVEAAHIRSVEANGPDILSNGLALSGTAHWMFDRGLIGLDDDMRILISRQANDRDSIRSIINASGRAILPPRASERPHPQFVRWHREHCFKR